MLAWYEHCYKFTMSEEYKYKQFATGFQANKLIGPKGQSGLFSWFKSLKVNL